MFVLTACTTPRVVSVTSVELDSTERKDERWKPLMFAPLAYAMPTAQWEDRSSVNL